jgi:hypothetical protein
VIFQQFLKTCHLLLCVTLFVFHSKKESTILIWLTSQKRFRWLNLRLVQRLLNYSTVHRLYTFPNFLDCSFTGISHNNHAPNTAWIVHKCEEDIQLILQYWASPKIFKQRHCYDSRLITYQLDLIKDLDDLPILSMFSMND